MLSVELESLLDPESESDPDDFEGELRERDSFLARRIALAARLALPVGTASLTGGGQLKQNNEALEHA